MHDLAHGPRLRLLAAHELQHAHEDRRKERVEAPRQHPQQHAEDDRHVPQRRRRRRQPALAAAAPRPQPLASHHSSFAAPPLPASPSLTLTFVFVSFFFFWSDCVFLDSCREPWLHGAACVLPLQHWQLWPHSLLLQHHNSSILDNRLCSSFSSFIFQPNPHLHPSQHTQQMLPDIPMCRKNGLLLRHAVCVL